MTRHVLTSTAREARFEAVFAEVYEPLQRYLRRRCAPSDVDDVLADVLLVVWRRIDEVPTDVPVAWCYGVARRSLANHRRGITRAARLFGRMARERPVDDAPPVEDPALARALSSLSAGDQELVRLWAWEALPPREIAVVLGISPNAASIRLHRVRGKLAELLRKEPTAAGHRAVGRGEGGPT